MDLLQLFIKILFFTAFFGPWYPIGLLCLHTVSVSKHLLFSIFIILKKSAYVF